MARKRPVLLRVVIVRLPAIRPEETHESPALSFRIPEHVGEVARRLVQLDRFIVLCFREVPRRHSMTALRLQKEIGRLAGDAEAAVVREDGAIIVMKTAVSGAQAREAETQVSDGLRRPRCFSHQLFEMLHVDFDGTFKLILLQERVAMSHKRRRVVLLSKISHKLGATLGAAFHQLGLLLLRQRTSLQTRLGLPQLEKDASHVSLHVTAVRAASSQAALKE
mmetsp:Transcript_17297/g.65925  ORF Transcript_17297/g.65925 Transcript_17297/m.65925 type:complete len:222 (-) Transcript_17297:1964-2629(-)